MGVATPSTPPPSATLAHIVRVLIVDDHPGFRASARALLESEGHAVVGEAADAAAARAAAGALAPDVVLLDVGLPDASGFDLARELSPSLAIVLTSSRDWSEEAQLVAACGARGFVSKDDLTGAALSVLVA